MLYLYAHIGRSSRVEDQKAVDEYICTRSAVVGMCLEYQQELTGFPFPPLSRYVASTRL